MSLALETDSREARHLDRVFLAGLLGAVLFVLWLPVFPTGDGPVHLYYADVLWSLVQHQPTYAHDYAIRHLFAPYLVHYLALVSFEHFVPPPLAEKLFIALIFLTQALGFRFLARRLGPNAAIASLWMLPLLFSWSLGGGFLNCCFATGVALWSFGIWVLLGTDARLFNGPAPGARLCALLTAHAGLLALLVLSHPVPLLVLLLFTASDLFLRLLTRPGWRLVAPHAGAFAMTCWAFLFPVLLAQKGQAAAVLPGIGFHLDVLLELIAGTRLGYFAGLSVHTFNGGLSIACRAGLLAIIPGVVLLLFKGKPGTKWPQAAQTVWPWTWLHKSTPAHRLLLISVLFLGATVFFPRSLNNSYFFPQRLWDICWLLVLACGAAAAPTARARHRLTAAGIVLSALTAITGLPALARIARAQQQLAAAALPPGKRGLFLEPASAVEGRGAATTYPVYAWSGARAFAASHAILLNSPWLGLTILPVRDAAPSQTARARAPLLDQGLASIYSESPLALTSVLAALPSGGPESVSHPGDRTAILARADFLLYVNPASLAANQTPSQASTETQSAALALLGADRAAWHCEAPGFYAVCLHTRQP